MTTFRYRHGNRLSVPRTLASRHFLYLAQPRELDAAACGVIVEAAKQRTYERGLYPGQIELFCPRELGEAVTDAFAKLTAPLMGLQCLDAPRAEILVTAQVFPHTDPSWAGASFLSIALHTGPEPYLVQTLHTGCQRGSQDVVASSRVIRQGDWFVFDPTTPHFAAPLHTHQDSLLILLQLELKDRTLEEREAILRELPARADDRNVEDFSFL